MTGYGAHMRAARRARGYTVMALERATGIHYQTIRSWEKETRTPRLDSLFIVTRVLGISIGTYVGEGELQ